MCGTATHEILIQRGKNSMKNTLDDFQNYCEGRGINMNNAQLQIAKELFNIPRAGGKTLLIALLQAYDLSAEKAAQDECKACGWKLYPYAIIRCDKQKAVHYCPRCDTILK